MDFALLKARLDPASGRIDSIEKLNAALTAAGVTDRFGHYMPTFHDGKGSGHYSSDLIYYLVGAMPAGFSPNAVGYERVFPNRNVSPARWWQMREMLRLVLGVYTPVPQLALEDAQGLHSRFDVRTLLGQLYAHLALDNSGRIAYTSSIEDGERDVQHVVNLPKLLRRLPATWGFGDAAYAQADAALKAELSDELTILPADQIHLAYEHGPSSCMQERNSNGYWRRANTGVHVTEAYNAPGWGCAVIEGVKVDDVQTYSQRALVWVNPADPSDKRFIRVYGSGPLARRLERNGYRCAGPEGARLKAIKATEDGVEWYRNNVDSSPLDDGADVYVVPYIDGAGRANDGQSVVVDSEPGFLRIVSFEERDRFNTSVQYSAANASNTCGMVALLTVPEDERKFTSAVTGQEHDILLDGRKRVVVGVENGAATFGFVTVTEFRRLSSAFHLPGVSVRALSTVPRFNHRGDYYLDTPVLREYCGYVLLDTARYGEARWVRENLARTINGVTGLVEDTIALIDPPLEGNLFPDTRRVFKWDMTPEMRKNYRVIRSVDGNAPTLRHVSVATVNVPGPGGKKLVSVPGIHQDVVELRFGLGWARKCDATPTPRGYLPASCVGYTFNVLEADTAAIWRDAADRRMSRFQSWTSPADPERIEELAVQALYGIVNLFESGIRNAARSQTERALDVRTIRTELLRVPAPDVIRANPGAHAQWQAEYETAVAAACDFWESVFNTEMARIGSDVRVGNPAPAAVQEAPASVEEEPSSHQFEVLAA